MRGQVQTLLTRRLNKREGGERKALLLNKGCSLEKTVYVNHIGTHVGVKEY